MSDETLNSHEIDIAVNATLGVPQQKTSSFVPAPGSALACKIADSLMEGWQGFHAVRLQLRGPGEQDMGGLCRESVVSIVDKELDAVRENS
jgi:hypothetical protein